MELVRQTIRLHSREEFGTRLPPHYIGHFFVELPKVIRQSVAMAVQNRSTTRGRAPAWLDRAADIRFVDHQNDDGVSLQFESARLKEETQVANSKQISQASAYDDPDGFRNGYNRGSW